jgi:hypothetical protein
MHQPTDRAAAHQTLDVLIAEAHGARQVLPRRERCEELSRQLRAAIGDLRLAAMEHADTLEERSRGWYRIYNLLDATDDVLAGGLGDGLLSAAIQVGALARQAEALRGVVTQRR